MRLIIDKKYSSGTGCCVVERPGVISSNHVTSVILHKWPYLGQVEISSLCILEAIRNYRPS